jgi:hypothetical protein
MISHFLSVFFLFLRKLEGGATELLCTAPTRKQVLLLLIGTLVG